MPRTQESTPSKFRKYVEEFGTHVLSTDGQVLRCQVCECELKAYQKSQVTQHVVGKKHVERVRKLTDQSVVTNGKCDTYNSEPCASSPSLMITQSEMEEEASRAKRARYTADLCSAFVQADIPFWKMNNPALKHFLEKYTEYKTPDETTIRKNYLFAEYEGIVSRIRRELDGKLIYLAIDETVDKTGRLIVNVVVGQLSPECAGPPRLLNVRFLEKIDQFVVEQLFEESLLMLWPNGPRHELVTLFVSDGTSYMKAAARSLQQGAFPHMVHVTCVAHDLQRVCKEIREQMHEVDVLVSNGKKVFLKALNRIRKFIDVAPDVSLPPEPIAAQPASWIHAATYYADNYATLCEVFSHLEDDSQSVKKVKLLLSSSKLKDDLTFIRGNYTFLFDTIARLENPGLALNDAMDLVATAYAQVVAVPGPVGRAIAEKLHSCLACNKGYLTMQVVGRILTSEASEEDRDSEDVRFLSPLQLASYKFAPVTLFDADRAFNRYKTVLRENRDRFSMENLQIYLVVHCNSF